MFRFSSIEEYQQDLSAGDTTCLEAVQHYLHAIHSNKKLNAFLEVYEAEAIDRALRLDAADKKGSLHGVVIGLKDNICYKDHQVTAASKILNGFTSLYSATAVERLLEEGAIIIGRQNCDEFGMGSTNENSPFGPVLNPLDHERVAGGSSGGSAAAVAAGLCMASLGSDTGGSVRLPASHCGVVGYKPSYGRISRYGLIAYASSFDQVGILSKNVKDAAIILDVISGPDAFDSTLIQEKISFNLKEENKKFRIGFFPSWNDHASVDPLIKSSMKNFIDELKMQGHQLIEADFPYTEYIIPTYYILTTAEASSNLARYDGVRYGNGKARPNQDLADFYKSNRSAGFGKEVKKRIMLGSFVLSAGYADAYFKKAQKARTLIKDHIELIFNDLDFIISPVSPQLAPKIAELDKDALAIYMGDIFTVLANLCGIPAISLPVFKQSNNLSLGLQIASGQQNEVSLLRFSHQLMQQ